MKRPKGISHLEIVLKPCEYQTKKINNMYWCEKKGFYNSVLDCYYCQQVEKTNAYLTGLEKDLKRSKVILAKKPQTLTDFFHKQK